MKFLFPVMIVLFVQALIFAQDAQEIAQPDIFLTQDTIPQDSIPSPDGSTPPDTTPPDTTMPDTTQAPPSDTTVEQDTTAMPTPDIPQIPPEVKKSINERSMEIGLMFGEPTGVSYKYFITDANAIDAAAAASFIPDAVFQLNADFLRHYYHFANVGEGRLPLVYGAGLAVQFRRDTRLGIRIPVGLTYIMQNLPIALFIDVAPRFDIVPDTEVSINAAVGIRYRFFPR